VVGIGGVKALFDEKYVIFGWKRGSLAAMLVEETMSKEITSTANVWGVPAIAWYTKDSLEKFK